MSDFFLDVYNTEESSLGDLTPRVRYRRDGDFYTRTFGCSFEVDKGKSQQSRCEPWSESLFFQIK